MLFGGEGRPRIRGRNDLILDVALYFDVVEGEGDAGAWRCHTLGYSYELQVLSGPSVLAFHFHRSLENVSYPHLHTRQYRSPVNLARAHIPSGRVPLEVVIRSAIQDLGVAPRRSDWSDVLDESERAWNRWRTW